MTKGANWAGLKVGAARVIEAPSSRTEVPVGTGPGAEHDGDGDETDESRLFFPAGLAGARPGIYAWHMALTPGYASGR